MPISKRGAATKDGHARRGTAHGNNGFCLGSGRVCRLRAPRPRCVQGAQPVAFRRTWEAQRKIKSSRVSASGGTLGERGIPALRLRESARRVLRRTIVQHVPAERAHGTGPAPKAKLLGPLASRGRRTAAGAPVLPWGETARVVAWSAAAWSVWRHRAGWREALWSVWRHRVGWREARGGHPGGRRRLHLKTHILLKDVPCETLLRAIRWSVVFRLFRVAVLPAAPRSKSSWVCCGRFACCFRVGVFRAGPGSGRRPQAKRRHSQCFFSGAGPGVSRRKQPCVMSCGRLVVGCAVLCGGFRGLVEISRVRAPACGPRLVSRWPGPRTPKYNAKILCSVFLFV